MAHPVAPIPVAMQVDVDPEGVEEETLVKYFGPGKFTVGDTGHLNEACNTIQQFIAQELCGNLAHTSSSGELCELFPAILTRIFGLQDATTIGPSSANIVGSGEESSWMFTATSFYAITDNLDSPQHRVVPVKGSSGPANTRGPGKDLRTCCMSPASKQLLALLLASHNCPSTGSKNIFGVLREAEALFGFAWGLLPQQSVAALRQEPKAASLLFTNSRLYTHCLVQRPASLSPASAMAMSRQMMPAVAPLLMLNMLENYLFSFALYALSSAANFYHGHGGGAGRMPPHHYGNTHVNASLRPERVALGWRRYGVRGLVHRNPYMALIKDYVEHLFPHGSGTGGGDASRMERECELFLRVLVEFWLEGNALHRPGIPKEVADQQAGNMAGSMYGSHPQHSNPHQAWSAHQEHRSLQTQNAAQMMAIHVDPVMAEIASDYNTPTDVSLHGLLVASTHLLADPRLLEACQSSAIAVAAVTSADGGGVFPGGNSSPMTPALALLRPHVFSFLRAAFSPGSTMETGSTAFALVVELWMLWLRPWAAPAILQGFSPRPVRKNMKAHSSGGGGRAALPGGGGSRGGIGSAFATFRAHGAGSAQVSRPPANDGGRGGSGGTVVLDGVGEYRSNPWAAWVIENYSLYTTILAAFVCKAVSMPLKVGRDGAGVGSGGRNTPRAGLETGTGNANLELLWRISDVYNADVVTLLLRCQATVQKYGQGTLHQSSQLVAGGDGRTSATDRSSGGVPEAGRAVEGLSFAEARILEGGRVALSAIQGPRLVVLPTYKNDAMDVLALISELAFPAAPQGRFEKMKQKVSHAVGNETTENERRAKAISSKLMQLFDVPSQWRPRGHAEPDITGGIAAGLAVMFKPDRDRAAPSFLSNEGQAQLISGRRACKPWDVSYVGDPMHRPLSGWETERSVDFWVGLSEKFNERWLGWASPMLDDDDRLSEASFEDEGPGRAIVMAKNYHQRVSRKGRWARLPRRLNLRPLADLRATTGIFVAMYVLMQAWRWNLTFGASLLAVYAGVCFRISLMDIH